jgi:hypothetical protein
LDIPLDTDDKDELGLCRHVVGTFLLAETCKTDSLALRLTVFLDVGFGPLEDDLSLLLVFLSKVSRYLEETCSARIDVEAMVQSRKMVNKTTA